MRKLYNSLFLSILFVVTCASFTQAQVTVLKSTTSLCRDIAMPVYYTAYGCDGQVQWLNYLQQPIGTSNVSSDVPGFQGTNTYYVKCGTGSPQVFYIDKTKTVRSTTPSIGASSTTINNGENATLTASGCGGTVSWMSGNYVLSNSSTLVVTPTTSTSYYALCTESGKCVSEASTQTITVTVNNPSLTAPVINTQNLGALSAGTSTTLGAFNCFYTVQWYKNGSSIGSGNSISVTPAACDSYTATCVNGSVVSPASNALVASATNPTITNQPQASSVCAGATATLSVVATGATSYQWRRNSTNISGETSASLTVSNITSANVGAYDVVISSTCGSVTSQATSFTILPSVTPTITTQPASSNVCIGGNHTLSVAATSASTYQWRLNGTNIDGATNASLLVTNVTNSNSGPYSVVVTGSCSSVTSQNAQLYPVSASSTYFWKEPVSATKCIGGTVSFDVGVNGYPSNYQWYKDGNPIGRPFQIPLTLTNLQPSDAGNYYCVVTHPCGTITTATAVLTISNGPNLSFSTTNVSCFGAANGSATVTPTSNSPYSYSWTNGGTTATINNLAPNTYTVTVTDGDGCTKSGSVSITEPTALALSTSNTAVSCKNGSNGSVTANPSGGTGEYSYVWSNGATTQTVTNLTAGTYNVTITDANGCTKTGSATVSEPTEILLTSSSVPVKCKGESNGSASVVASGGIAPYTYSWAGFELPSNATLSNVPAGTYTVTVTDGNGCTKSTTIEVVEATTLLTITGTPTTAVKCNGGNDGTASVNVTGGAGTYSYTWTTGASTQTISNLSAGEYGISVLDAYGCVRNASVIITEPTLLTLSTSNVAVKCKNGNDGSATVTPAGGTSPYSYSWSNGATTQTATNLVAGTYNVTVTDANNCSKTTSVVVTEPTLVVLSMSSIAVKCKNGNDGSATVNVTGGTGGYSYLWSTGAITSTINNLVAGTYSVTVTDANNCSKNSSVIVTEPTELMISGSSVSVKCKNGNDGSATVTATGGTAPYTYLWDRGARSATLSNVSAGTYNVTVTDANNCVKNINVVVTEPTALSIATSNVAVKCKNGNDGSATVTATGGTAPYTYTWSNGATTATANNLTAGTYNITVTDANGCSQTASVSISEPTELIVTSSSVSVKCKNGNDGSATITVSGGTSPYTYVWNNGATTTSIANLVAGTYSVTVTDANNCVKNINVVVTEPTLVVLSTSSIAVKCKNGNDGSATVNVTGGTGGYSYLWSTGATTATINSLVAGTYSVTVTDANNCSKNSSVIVTEPTELMISGSSVSVKCKNGNDGSATVTATGGTAPYTYLWDRGARSATLSNVSAGTYNVTVTDANNCVKNINVVVTEPTALSISTSNVSVKCKNGNDGSATVTATGGTAPYTYTWSNGATTATANNLTAGTYNITVTDANGCSQTASVSISEPTELMVISNSVSVKCKNGNDGSATITVSGGTSPYTYVWNNGATTTRIANLVAGTYSVTVTDANNCVKNINIVVTEPTELLISTSSIAVKCKNGKDGSVTVNATGGTGAYTYRWSNGSTSPTATNLTAGTYSVTVTDANNCSKNSTVVVTEPTALTYQFTKEDVKCNAGSDGKITVIAQGGTSPYKFIYNGTTSADLTVATLKAGEYAINVQDNNNCLATEQKATLTQPAALEVSIAEELMPRGFQTKDGRLVTKIVGGTTKQASLYTTAWLFEGTTTVLDKQVLIAGGTNSTIDKIQGGNYTLTVTDDNFALSKTNEGCKKVFTYFVKQPDKIVSVAAVDKSVSCFGKFDGKLTATVKGGVTFKTGATYLYKWFKQDQAGWINLNLSTATIQYVDAGQYMVKIEDANGITDSTQVSLKVTPSISSKVISQVNPSCSASKDGVIEVQAIGAVEPITVTWSKALTGTKITNLAQGNYFGIIKDNAGCFGEVTVTLTAKENVSAELISKKELVCADKCDAILELAVKGANSPYTVQWSNGAIGLKNSQLCAGTYSATIKTTNGCAVSVDNMKLDAPQAFKIEVSNDVDICSESTLEINAASKVAQGLSYVWTYPNGTKSTNPIASIKTAGTYKIEVVNASGCSASDEFKVNVQNVITGINFTVASQGQVGESIYAVNLSPTSLATTWNVIGSADILQNDKAILMIKPTAEGTLKVELTATVGTCKANLVKSISIGKASTVTPKSTPKVELESIDDLFLVYPNPNEGHFAIKADPSMEGEVQIKIYNASLSEVLYTETFDTATKSQIEVTIPEVLNNLLYVVIQSQNKKTVKRVLVRP